MTDNDVTDGPENVNGPVDNGGGAGGGEPPGPGAAGSEGSPPAEPQNAVLSLAQLIGSPIHALVEAEAQSAMATARFIEAVGFEAPQDDKPGTLGDLRMARFNRVRSGPEGERQEEVQIPLLTLLPIPALQIRDAELEYYVKVIQAETLPQQRDELSQILKLKDGMVIDPRATVRATFTGEPRPGARRSIDMLLKMKVRIEQADMPNGLAKLLNIAGESVTHRSVEPPRDEDGEAPADEGGRRGRGKRGGGKRGK